MVSLIGCGVAHCHANGRERAFYDNGLSQHGRTDRWWIRRHDYRNGCRSSQLTSDHPGESNDHTWVRPRTHEESAFSPADESSGSNFTML